jgi:hypothetical protein
MPVVLCEPVALNWLRRNTAHQGTSPRDSAAKSIEALGKSGSSNGWQVAERATLGGCAEPDNHCLNGGFGFASLPVPRVDVTRLLVTFVSCPYESFPNLLDFQV